MRQTENKQPPDLSVIIAAWNGAFLLGECLSSLEKQISGAAGGGGGGGVEVLVVSNFETGIPESKNRFPFARHIFLREESTVPELRARGIFEARGAVIALLEDLCTFDLNWRCEIEKAHAMSYSIVGGSIEKIGIPFSAPVSRGLDWAVYLYDYGKYILPARAGTVDTLSGMNVSYKRNLLVSMRDHYRNGFFETFVHEELKRRGHELYLMPSAIIYHNKNYDLKEISVQFYHQARSYAAHRVRGLPLYKRVSFLLVSLILPVLLPARVVVRTINKGRHFAKLIKSLPFLIILLSVWSYGEFRGYSSGEGNSSKKWK